MKEFFEYIVKNLVDDPDAVDIQIVEGENGTYVEVRVAQDDVAKVVGRKGRIINSLRTIALTVGARFNQRVRLELIDKEPANEAAPEVSNETAEEVAAPAEQTAEPANEAAPEVSNETAEEVAAPAEQTAELANEAAPEVSNETAPEAIQTASAE